MALAIRLARGGMKKRPYYRIVVTDSRNARDGKFLEKIGTYNPLLPKDSAERVKLDTDRASHWLSVGAQPSDRVARFLDAAGVRTRAARVNLQKGEPGDKAKERAETNAANAAKAEEAAKQAVIDAREAAEAAAAAEAEAAAEAAAAPVADEAVTNETPTDDAVANVAAVAEAAPAAGTADEAAPVTDAVVEASPEATDEAKPA